jgi:hypothetical protein
MFNAVITTIGIIRGYFIRKKEMRFCDLLIPERELSLHQGDVDLKIRKKGQDCNGDGFGSKNQSP